MQLYLLPLLVVLAVSAQDSERKECMKQPTLNDAPSFVPTLANMFKGEGPMCPGAEPLDFYFEVISTECEPLPARVDIWQATAEGVDGICNRTVYTDETGQGFVRTIKPGTVNNVPAHFNVRVSVGGYQSLTTQVYFNFDDMTLCTTASCKDTKLRVDRLPLLDTSMTTKAQLVLAPLHHKAIGLDNIDLDNDYGAAVDADSDLDADDLSDDDSDDDDDDGSLHFVPHLWHHHKKMIMVIFLVLSASCCAVTWSYYYYKKAKRQIRNHEARIALLERRLQNQPTRGVPVEMKPVAKTPAPLPPKINY